MALLGLVLLMAGCGDDPVPKPRGYFRIDLPADSARTTQGPCPWAAEIPGYSNLGQGGGTGHAHGDACWTNLVFPAQRAAVHMTWRRIQGDLPELIRDAHEFKDKHEVLATRIRTENFINDSTRVYGTLFDVEGNVASPAVFYLTDSTDNFLYGALYFDVRPNADSLAPVTARIRDDIRRLARTLRWDGPAGAVQHVQQGGQ
ncbi:MAG TPA: hypothetical protein PKD45_04985 [Flavobacteriales bacterium]|nr:hypothetical protein [Flavobacteriales bacterium]